MNREDLNEIVELVGIDFLSYASNTDPTNIRGMQSGADMSPQISRAVVELKNLIETQSLEPDEQADSTISVKKHLSMLHLGSLLSLQFQGNSIGNAIRILVGGTIPTIPSRSELERELVKYAIDVYPLLLLPRETGDEFPDFMNLAGIITPSIFRNEYDSLFDAFEGDEALDAVFKQRASNGEQNRRFKSFSYWLNTGSGSGFQLASFPAELVIPAYYKCLAEQSMAPEEFMRQVVKNLRDFKKLVSGESVVIKAYIALNGPSISSAMKVTLPWGKLRQSTQTEETLLRHRSQLMNSVLEVPFHLKMKRVSDLTNSPYPFAHDREREKMEDAAMLTSASFMVGLGKDKKIDNVGTIVLPCFGFNPHVSWPLERPGMPTFTITTGNKNRMERIAVLINNHKAHLNIALRRNLMAINRLDSLDGFIDGVIAMESLFGSNKETTFTVSAAMAKFLRRDIDDRIALKKDISKLYTERSKIIHGVSFPSPEVIEVKRQKVIDLNLEALQKLILRRQDLVDSTSSDRSAKILLT